MTLLLSKTIVPIIISMLLGRILSLGLLIHQGFSLLALPGTTLDLRCRWLIGTTRFGFPKPSGDILSLSGWLYRTDLLPRISFSAPPRCVGMFYLVGLPVGNCCSCIGLLPFSYVHRGGAVSFSVSQGTCFL